MPPRDDDSPASGDLRRLLLDAAREILREPDTPLDLRKVAERAGKSRTAPYLVFGKESEGGGLLGLKIAVAAEGAREMAERMEVAADTAYLDPMRAFQAVAMAFLAFVEENRRLFRLMYGPDLGALPRLGEEAFLGHPEVELLLRHRDGAGAVVARIIREAQEAGFLSPDPPDDLGKPYEQSPSGRRLQIAWSAMIGVALLRDDELLRAIRWHIDRKKGARLIVESVFGLDPQVVGEAADAFLESRGVGDEEEEDEAGHAAPFIAEERTAMLRAPTFAEPTFAAPPDDEDDEETLFLEMLQEPEEEPAGAAPRMQDPVPFAAAQSDLFPPPEPEATLSHTLARHSGLARAARSQALLSRAHILWIDDHPEWIQREVETLERLGARVTVVTTTEAAKRILGHPPTPQARPFHVILSDIARGSRPDAGIRALPALRKLAPDVPVIFFVGALDRSLGVPKGAAGITNRTNELLHLVLDALEGR